MSTINRVVDYTRPREPNASHPDAREPDAREPEDDYSDLRVAALDHDAIWSRYNAKAGQIQGVIPAKLKGDE